MDANTESLWSSAKTSNLSSRLAGNVTCDICVVGAGIAGLTSAYLLAKEGKTGMARHQAWIAAATALTSITWMVVSAIGDDPTWRRRLLGSSLIHRLNLGAMATAKLKPPEN